MKLNGVKFTKEEFKEAYESFLNGNTYRVLYGEDGKISDLTKEPTMNQVLERILELREQKMVK